jgi:hypothetical protein
MFASVITLGELRRGVEDLPLGKRRTNPETWLANVTDEEVDVLFARDRSPGERSISRDWVMSNPTLS